MTNSKREEDRIRQVYKNYADSESAHRRWDPRNLGNQAIARELWGKIGKKLSRNGGNSLVGKRVLEIGCGVGGNLSQLLQFGARPEELYGVDLLEDRITRAREVFPKMHFTAENARKLSFSDGFFDLVMFFTVFSSILDAELAGEVAREARRVLRQGGAVLWYDMRRDNPWNPNIIGMTQARISNLFPRFSTDLRSITLLPPLARRLGALTPWVYPCLATVPPLRSHYLGFLQRAG